MKIDDFLCGYIFLERMGQDLSPTGILKSFSVFEGF